MKLNWKARYRRAPVLALMVAMVVLAAIPHSLSGADPRDQAAPAKEQAPRETPAAVFERDPAVEFYVDLDLLTRAARAQDPAGLADAGLQLCQAERILLRHHRGGLTGGDVVRKAAALAARKHDMATLDRLTSAAEKSGDKDLRSYLANLGKLAKESRAVDPAATVSVDEISAEGFALLKGLRHQLRLAELLNDPEQIKMVELRMGIGNRLPQGHKEALLQRMNQIREGFPNQRSATDIALAKLVSASRDVSDLSNSQWDTQYIAPNNAGTVYAQVTFNGGSGTYSVNGTQVGELTLQPPVPPPLSPNGQPQQGVVLCGTWHFDSTGDSGTFEWNVYPDESGFSGNWTSQTLGTGNWSGTRTGTSGGAGGGVTPDPTQGGAISPDPGLGTGGAPFPGGGVAPDPVGPGLGSGGTVPLVPPPLGSQTWGTPHNGPPVRTRQFDNFNPNQNRRLRSPSRGVDQSALILPTRGGEALGKLQGASRDWGTPIKVGGELGKLGGDASSLGKQATGSPVGQAVLGNPLPLFQQWDPHNPIVQKYAAANLKVLDPGAVYQSLEGGLKALKGLKAFAGDFRSDTGDIDLRKSAAGQAINTVLAAFAQGNSREWGVDQFDYNVRYRKLTLAVHVRHHQTGDGITVYDLTQRFSASCSFYPSWSVSATLDLGGYYPVISTSAFAALEEGDIIGYYETISPDALGKWYHHEQTNQFTTKLTELNKEFGAANVYFASPGFVQKAATDKLVRIAANAVLSGGYSLYPTIMSDCKQLIAGELPNLVIWLSSRGIANAEPLAQDLLSGKYPTLKTARATLQFRIVTVPYSSRGGIEIGNYTNWSPWVMVNHFAYVVILQDLAPQVPVRPAVSPSPAPETKVYFSLKNRTSSLVSFVVGRARISLASGQSGKYWTTSQTPYVEILEGTTYRSFPVINNAVYALEVNPTTRQVALYKQ